MKKIVCSAKYSIKRDGIQSRDFAGSMSGEKRGVVIAQIACHDGHLPQGAPTSPIITKLICRILDY